MEYRHLSSTSAGEPGRSLLRNVFGTGTIAAVLLALAVAGPGWAQSRQPYDEAAFAAAATAARSEGIGFSVLIEQGGSIVTPQNGDTVTIDRAPFRIWVVYTEPIGLLLNVSPNRTLHRPVSRGAPLSEALGTDYNAIGGMGVAEESHNARRSIFLFESFGAHYLLSPDSANRSAHRFNRIVRHPDFVAGGRDVRHVVDLGAGRAQHSISEIPYEMLYVTALHTQYDSDYNPVVVGSSAFRLRLRE